MNIINTLSDIESFRDNDTLDECITSYLEKYFITLSKQLCDGKESNDFSLEKYGCIVFLENAEDCKNLSLVGLHNEYKSYYPEYVEQVSLQGKNGVIELYCSCIVINNDTALTVFSTKGTLDVETERFLSNECI